MLAPLVNKPEWFFDWTGECVAIVAAGTSVTQADVDKLRGRIHVCAINNSYKLCKWADVLYACDVNWWTVNNGAKDFLGLKVRFENNEKNAAFEDVHRIRIAKSTVRRVATNTKEWANDIRTDEPGTLGSGANSGFQAINLMVQFGVTGILLLGFDYKDNDKNKVHWHGQHSGSLHNPTGSQYKKWLEHITTAAPVLHSLGVDVVNCSPFTAIECFPKMSIEDCLTKWGL